METSCFILMRGASFFGHFLSARRGASSLWWEFSGHLTLKICFPVTQPLCETHLLHSHYITSPRGQQSTQMHSEPGAMSASRCHTLTLSYQCMRNTLTATMPAYSFSLPSASITLSGEHGSRPWCSVSSC